MNPPCSALVTHLRRREDSRSNASCDCIVRRSSGRPKRQLKSLWPSFIVIPAKAGIVRLKAHLVREVEVLFRYALSGL